MIGKTKILVFLFILNIPSSLLKLLVDDGLNIPSQVLADANAESKPINPLTPHIYEVTDTIHQIDVKDEQTQVISNINDVLITNELDNLQTNINPGVNNQVVDSNLNNGPLVTEPIEGKAVKTVDDNNTKNLKTNTITVGGQNSNNYTNDVKQQKNFTNKTVNNIKANNLNNSFSNNQNNDLISGSKSNNVVNNSSISKGNVNVSNIEDNLLNGNNVILDDNENFDDDTHYNKVFLDINEGSENDPSSDIAWRSDFRKKKTKGTKVKNTVDLQPQNGTSKDDTSKNNMTLTANKTRVDSTVKNSNNLRGNTTLTNTNQINNLTYTKTEATATTGQPTVGLKNTDNTTNINTIVPNDDYNKSNPKSQELNATNLIEPDNDTELSFRSDFSKKKSKMAAKVSNKSKIYSETSNDYRYSGKNETKPSNNGGINADLNNVFMILNSGNIRNFQADIPGKYKAGDQKFDSGSDNNDQNSKSDNSKLVNSIINSSIDKIASNILDPNKSIRSENVFLILNSGTISNFHVNPRTPNDTKNNTLAKDTAIRIQTTNKNKTKPGPEASFGIKSFIPFIDVKFRNDNLNSNKENLPKLSASLSQSNNHDLLNKDSLKSKLTNELSNEIKSSNQNKPSVGDNNNDFGNPLPGVLPNNLGIELNGLNVLNGAMDMLNRLKRDTEDFRDKPKNDNQKSKEDTDSLIKCENCDNELQILDNDILNQIKSNGESFDYTKLKNMFNYDKNSDVECPLSIIFKQVVQQNFDEFLKGDTNINNLYPYLNSLAGKDVINLATKEIMKLPFSLDLKLQLLRGDPKDFVNELSKNLNSILCKLN